MRALLVTLALLLSAPAWGQDTVFRGVGTRGPKPWGSVGTILTANSAASSATTWAPVTSAQLDSGNVGVCIVAKDETGSGTTDGTGNAQFTSVADAAGNTWVEAYEWCNMQSSTVANGACVAIYYTKATANLASGAAITFTFSAATLVKAATCWEFSTTSSSLAVATGSNGLANDGADPGSMTAATTVVQEHLFLRVTACETLSTTYTKDADYSEFTYTSSTYVGANDAASMGARGEFRIATEQTSAASDPGFGTSDDCASAMIALDSN